MEKKGEEVVEGCDCDDTTEGEVQMGRGPKHKHWLTPHNQPASLLQRPVLTTASI